MNSVRPHGDFLRFYVTSSENKDAEYLVDLDCYWGTGWCNCPHFKNRLEPKLAAMALRLNHRIHHEFRCKHIRSAVLHLGQALADELLRGKMKNKENHEQS